MILTEDVTKIVILAEKKQVLQQNLLMRMKDLHQCTKAF
jgi:hypothetical protein